jgi:hypothetical protein
MALEKAAKCPLFPLNLRLLFQKLKFWKSLLIGKTDVGGRFEDYKTMLPWRRFPQLGLGVNAGFGV